VRGPRGRRLTPILAAAVLLVAACTGSSDGSPPPETKTPTSSAPVTSSPTPTETDRVLAQYASFFLALNRASRMSETPRNQLLAEYLSGAAYSSAVATLSSQAAFGKVVYGKVVLHPDVTSINETTAVVTDCQDTSHSGVKDRKTGHKETKGIPRALVITNFTAIGGSWKIVKIDYRGAKC
jgi:hypothetical protein